MSAQTKKRKGKTLSEPMSIPGHIPSSIVPIEGITEADFNYNTHDAVQLDELSQSLADFGQFKNIIVWQGQCIAGNGLLQAARLRGDTHIEIKDFSHLTRQQAEALLIADNATPAGSKPDVTKLQSLLSGLDGLRIPGVTPNWTALMGLQHPTHAEASGITIPDDELDDVPDVDEIETFIERGEVWQCGKHRVMCRDSTNATDVDLLLCGTSVALCLTDPPYGIGDTISKKNAYDVYDDTVENLRQTINGFFPIAQRRSQVVLLTPGNANQRLYPLPSWTLAWVMPAGVGSGPWGFCCWQPVLAYGKDPYLSHGLGRRPDILNKTEATDKTLDHPCAKPVNVWIWMLERGSVNSNDSVYDPFLGSGTTMIACEQTGRRCYGMEISPKYCSLAVRRWEHATGQTAQRIEA